MDIVDPQQLIVRKEITLSKARNAQMTIEIKWFENAGYKPGEKITVFDHAPTGAMMLLPKKMATSVIKAKKGLVSA
jgi:hypothetical protein